MNTIDDRRSPPVRALLRQAEGAPDSTVLVTGQEKWTSLRLAEQSGRLAARDIKPGDRVALHMHNTAEAVLGYLACLRLGSVVEAAFGSNADRLRQIKATYDGDGVFTSVGALA